MPTPLNIPIILGASRPERQSAKVAALLQSILEKNPNVSPVSVDVRDFEIEYDEKQQIPEFHAITTAADAFVLVFPEYNHGFPGKFKTLLDTEFATYKHKPVLVASVSSGQFGGVRAVESLLPILSNFGMIVSGKNLHFPFVKELFDDAGQLKDEKVLERAERMVDELIELTQIIQVGKEGVKTAE
ncbi:MAG: NADPH-dependent FMN reductase [Patescibacteria group bacterium]